MSDRKLDSKGRWRSREWRTLKRKWQNKKDLKTAVWETES